MKKLLTAFVAFALLLSLVACGAPSEPGEMTERKTETETAKGTEKETVSETETEETENSDLSRGEDTDDGYGEFIPF